jgi:hypothetical protein
MEEAPLTTRGGPVTISATRVLWKDDFPKAKNHDSHTNRKRARPWLFNSFIQKKPIKRQSKRWFKGSEECKLVS